MYIDAKFVSWERFNLNQDKKLTKEQVIRFLETHSLDDIDQLRKGGMRYPNVVWSREYMSPNENDHMATVELYDDHGIKIWDNSSLGKIYSFREGNQLIAEFMGFEFRDDENQYYHIEEGYYLCTPEELRYHASWDWLMEVVRQCNSTTYEESLINLINSSVTAVNLEQTWVNCVNYIKWFNKSKK